MAGRSKRISYLEKKAADLGVVQLDVAVAALKTLEESLPKGVKRCSFDQTVEIAVRLGVDSQHNPPPLTSVFGHINLSCY